jgi:putative membrane protein
VVIDPLAQLLPATALLIAGGLYGAAALRLTGHRVPWPAARTAAFMGGLATLGAAVVLPGLLGSADGHDPRLHMTQHLLLAMLGPLLIAVSAPVTLALRTLRPPARRRLLRFLRRRPVRALSHPATALALSAGGLYLLVLTPFHVVALHDPLLHAGVQVHLVLAGTLFAWAVVGIDPMPRRPSVRTRGAVLLAAIALHTVLSRLLFGEADRLAAQAGGSVEHWRQAAELMWYEGDLVELALLAVFVVQAHRLRSRGSRAPRDAAPAPAG